MKKTLTVNISGIVFHIDEDAYEKLNQYLASVRRHFTPDDGCDEIMADIESRIAETLQEKISRQQTGCKPKGRSGSYQPAWRARPDRG
jgi:hypothetical protein